MECALIDEVRTYFDKQAVAYQEPASEDDDRLVA
jgi:hypothetical protein